MSVPISASKTVCRRFADAGDGGQLFDLVTKGLDGRSRLRLQFFDRSVELVDLPQVQPEHEPVVLGHAPSKRLEQVGSAGFEPTGGQANEDLWVGVSLDQGVQDRTTALAQQIGDVAVDLQVGVFEH